MTSSPQILGMMLASVPSLLRFAMWSAMCGVTASSILVLQVMGYSLNNAHTEETMEYTSTVTYTVPASTCLEGTIESTAQASFSPSSTPAQPTTTQAISTVASIVISIPDLVDVANQSATATQILTGASTLVQPTSEPSILEQAPALWKRDVACPSEPCATTTITSIAESSAFTGLTGGFGNLSGTTNQSACITTVTTFVTLPYSFTEPLGNFTNLSGTATQNPCTTTATTFITLPPTFNGPIISYSTLFNNDGPASNSVPNSRACNADILPISTHIHQLPAAFDTTRFTSKPYWERPIRSVAPTRYNTTAPIYKLLLEHDSSVGTLPVGQVETLPPAHNALPSYAIVLIVLAGVFVCFAFCAFLACGT